MFKRIFLLNNRGFLQKKDNFNRGFLFSPLLIIPLFLVIISGLLIKSIQGEFLVSNYLGHIVTGFLGYFLAFFISYIPLERLRKYLIPFYLCTLISLLLIYFFGISVSGAQRWLNLGIFSFQPSEVAKLSTVLTLALVLDKKIISKAIKSIIEEEIVSSLREKKETLLKKISAKLISEEKVSEELAINSAKEGFEEVERLLANHSEAV